MPFSLTEQRFYAWDTVIKVAGFAALAISGAFAYHQFSELKEQEYKRAFYEKQMSVISEVFSVLLDIDAAPTVEERSRAVRRFFMIYQGSGRTFLSPGLYASLNGEPLEYVQVCIRKVREAKLISDCSQWTGSRAVAGFALAARSELANTWKTGFSEISTQDPWSAEGGVPR